MYATNYFEKMVLNTIRGQTATAPSALYLALYLNNPGESGTEGTEVSYAGYSRQPVVFSSPAPVSGGMGIENTEDLTFPMAPSVMSSVTHIGVMDSQTGSNMLIYGEFTEGLSMEANESPVIVAGEAKWWLMGNFSMAFRQKVLGLLCGKSMVGFIPHLGLFQGNPEDGGAELSGENYERVAMPFSAPAEQVGGQMKIALSERITLVRSNAPWGLWNYTAVCDAVTGGQVVYYVSRPPKDVRKGVQVIVPEGGFTLSFH